MSLLRNPEVDSVLESDDPAKQAHKAVIADLFLTTRKLHFLFWHDHHEKLGKEITPFERDFAGRPNGIVAHGDGGFSDLHMVNNKRHDHVREVRFDAIKVMRRQIAQKRKGRLFHVRIRVLFIILSSLSI